MSRWIQRQKHDPFVRKRNEENVIARSYFKIEEIFHAFFAGVPKKRILDLGSAPGGWSQFFKKNNSYVIGIDLLPMKIAVDEFYQMDILSEIPLFQRVHIVCSDIAPNISGNRTIDDGNMVEIAHKVMECVDRYLLEDGCFVMKVFMGASSDLVCAQVKQRFKSYKIFKPQASRSESSEVYVVAMKKLRDVSVKN